MRSLKAEKSDRVLDGDMPARKSKAKSGAKAKAPVERALPKRNRRRRIALLAGLMAAAGLVGTGVYGYSHDWHGKTVAAIDSGIDDGYRAVGLAVAEVTISGRDRAGIKGLRKSLDVQIGDPILRLDLSAIREKLERHGWVQTAEVTRVLPDRLHISINERAPFARWQLNGRTSLIDPQGEVIVGEVGHRFAHLPRLVGPDANMRAGELFDLLERSPRLAAQVKTASLIRARRWDIGMANGVTIRLPETEAESAWIGFNEVDRRDGLLAQRLKVIDLRVPGRVIVRLAPKPEVATGTGRET